MIEMLRAAGTISYLLAHPKQPMVFILTRAAASTRQHPDVNWQVNNTMHTQKYEMMRSALTSLLMDPTPSDSQLGLSREFVHGLLSVPDVSTNERIIDQSVDDKLYRKLKGLPQRPFYIEIMRRLQIIRDHKVNNLTLTGTDMEENNIMFLPAAHFGMTEFKMTDSLIPPINSLSSVQECSNWLRQAGEKGILALLGMRRTVGTASIISSNDNAFESYLLPPSSRELLDASCKLHKPNTKSSLTVGARALTKHADRGQSRFYGNIQGSESAKNEHAEQIVKELIQKAAWINIHNFGGTEASRPVVEVRTDEGYGARWSALWIDAFTPVDVTFRGFLEPQMEDGHEKRWRH